MIQLDIKKGKQKLIVQLLVHMYFILKEEDTILAGGEGVNLFKQLKPGEPKLGVREAWCYIAGLRTEEGREQPMSRRAGSDEMDGGKK